MNVLTDNLLTGAGLLLSVLPMTSCNQEKPKEELPNIVVIVADDLGYGDMSCYGATRIKTPQIDSLAAQGVKFTDAYVASSLCSPSRYSILTGRYSWRTDLKFGVLTYFALPLINENRTTIASLLKKHDYHTACVGKWHLGLGWQLKENAPPNPQKNVFNSWDLKAQDYIDFSKRIPGGPNEKGFDYFYGMAGSDNMIPFAFIENDSIDEAPSVPKGVVYDFDENCEKAPNWDSRTVNRVLTAKAVKVVDDHFKNEADKPLFLYFPASAPHRPCLPTITKGESQAGLRGDMVVEFDWSVKQVVDALKRNHAFENTLLIVTSDNGPRPGDPLISLEMYKKDSSLAEQFYYDYFDDYQAEYQDPNGNPTWKEGWLTYGHRAAGPLLGFKSDAWEGGLRVPFIVHWPGKVKPGSINHNVISTTDLLATFAEVVGDTLSSQEGEDSYSFLSNLLDNNAPQVRTSLTVSSGGSGAMVEREGGWKYIEAATPHWNETYYPGGPFITDPQLYNIEQDESESHNVYSDMPDKVSELKKIVDRVKKEGRSEGGSEEMESEKESIISK